MEVLQYTILGFSLKFWIIWTILNAIPGWWLVYKKRNWKRPEAANDPKYRPFHSIDDPYKNYSYLWCLPLFMFSIPRFLIGWCFFSSSWQDTQVSVPFCLWKQCGIAQVSMNSPQISQSPSTGWSK